MNQKLDLSIRGLYTAPNELSGVASGALLIADNILVPAKNLAVSRRGQKQYNLAVDQTINKIFNYNATLILNYGNKMAWDFSSQNMWWDYPGEFYPPTGFKMRQLEALRNLYFTTTKGIYKIDHIPNDFFSDYTPSPAGVARALGGTAVVTGTDGFLPDNSSVAYRTVWGYYDENNTIYLGPPSSRIIVSNTSGSAKDVELTVRTPLMFRSCFVQIYRSPYTANFTDTPTDEMQLVIQKDFPNSAGGTTIELDQTPENLRGTTLYTSPSQQGIENANDAPPFAVDMDVFKECTFYGNTKQKQSLEITLISVNDPSFGYINQVGDTTNGSDIITNLTFSTNFGSYVGKRVKGFFPSFPTPIFPIDTVVVEVLSFNSIRVSQPAMVTTTANDFQLQDRFTIANTDFWASSVSGVFGNEFIVENAGTISQNIEQTAKNLIDAVNSIPTMPIYAYYNSSADGFPGSILFREKEIGGEPYYATSSRGSSFNPTLPEWNELNAITSDGQIISVKPIITSANGYTSGSDVFLQNTNSTPSIDGTKRIVSVAPTNTFSIPMNEPLDAPGTSGKFMLVKDMVISSNDAKQNRVFISKPGQPEAVPLYRYFDVGSANYPIIRVIALRDGIFFFKKDGIYRCSGETFESFSINLVDNTVSLKAPESAVTFNNQIFCMTTQGVCAVTDSGVQLISVPIENVLLQLSSEEYPNFSDLTFGIGYESERIYCLYTISEKTDTQATQAFVYNSLTDSWTRFVMPRNCGTIAIQPDKMIMAKDKQVMIERKTGTNYDYADEDYRGTISNISGKVMRFNLVSAYEETALPASVLGMTIKQGNREQVVTKVTVISPTVVDLTVASVNGFSTTGYAYLFTPIINRLRWTPIDGDNAGMIKKFSEVTFIFKNAAFLSMDAVFSTNISTAGQLVPVINNSGTDAWGSFPWGSVDWGGELGGQCVLRTYVPREKQLGSWLNITLQTKQAFTGFSLEGLSLIFDITSSRIK